jgi:hypothetical protein
MMEDGSCKARLPHPASSENGYSSRREAKCPHNVLQLGFTLWKILGFDSSIENEFKLGNL